MIGRFKPVTGVMEAGIGQFTLPGNNAGFCAAILQKNREKPALRLESLTYVRPGETETSAPLPAQQTVVNLLIQLRAYYDQSNTFLRSQTALNLQLTSQLRQALASSSGPVRLRAGEIERAVRENLYRDGEFQRAIDSLAREIKKNGVSAAPLKKGGSGRPEAFSVPPPLQTVSAAAPALSNDPAAHPIAQGRALPPPPVSFPVLEPLASVSLTPASSRQTPADDSSGKPKTGRTAAEKPVQKRAGEKKRGKRTDDSTGQQTGARLHAGQTAGTETASGTRRKTRGLAAEKANEPSQNGERQADRQSTPARSRPQATAAPVSSGSRIQMGADGSAASGGPAAAALMAVLSPAGEMGRFLSAGSPFVGNLPDRIALARRQNGTIRAGWKHPDQWPAWIFAERLTARRELLSLAGRPIVSAVYGSPAGSALSYLGPVSKAAAEDGEVFRFALSHRPAVGNEPPRGDEPKEKRARAFLPRPGLIRAETRPVEAVLPSERVEHRVWFRAVRPWTSTTGPPREIAVASGGLKQTAFTRQNAERAFWPRLLSIGLSHRSDAAPLAEPVARLPVFPGLSGVLPPVGHTGLALYRTIGDHLSAGEGRRAQNAGEAGATLPPWSARQTGPVWPTLVSAQEGKMRTTEPSRSSPFSFAAKWSFPFFSPAATDQKGPAVNRAVWPHPATQNRSGTSVLPGGPLSPLPVHSFGIGRPEPPAATGFPFAPTGPEGPGPRLIQMHSAVRALASGETSEWAIRRAEQASAALAALDRASPAAILPAQARRSGILRRSETSLSGIAAFRPGRTEAKTRRPVAAPATAGLTLHSAPAEEAANEYPLAAGPGAAETQAVTLRRTATAMPGHEAAPRIIYRMPERPAAAAPTSEGGESEGEAVLQAQTISPARAAAMNAIGSYPPGQTADHIHSPVSEPLSREQEDQITRRVLEDINYNRMASEVLDRVERRLRTERRKFGR